MKKIALLLSLVVSLMSMSFAAETDKNILNLDQAKDEKVIVQAADWAGEEKEADAIPGLLKLLTDSRDAVRLHAVMALGYIGEESAVDGLNNTLLNDKNATVRYAAVLATVRIGSEKSIVVWKKALKSETDPYTLDFLNKMQEKAKGK